MPRGLTAPGHPLSRVPSIKEDVVALDQGYLILIAFPYFVLGEFGCALQLLLCGGRDVAAKRLVLFQHRPRNGIMIAARAEESAEAEYRIGNLTGELFDPEILDAADLLAVPAVNGCSFDFFA